MEPVVSNAFDLMTFITPFVQLVFAAASAAVATLVPVAIKWFLQKIHLDGLVSDDMVRGYLNPAIDKAINLAKAKVYEQKISINVDNAIAKFVLEYLSKHTPDALAHFGLTEDKVTEMVKARLVKFTTAPVSPPVV
jgi:hypothetical protein